MITLKQRGRAGLQFLGSLQQFSSSELRDQAEADYAAQPEAPALAAEWQAGDVRPHVWRERLERARDVVERSKAYRYNRFYQRFVAEQNFVRAIPAVEQRRKEWEALVEAKKPKDESRLKLDPQLPIPRWYEGVEWHLEPGGWDGYDLAMPMFMAGIGPHVFALGGYAAVDVNCDIRSQRKNVLSQFRRRDFRRIYEAGCGGATTLAVARQLFPQAELVGGDLSPALLKNGHFVSEMMNLGITFRQEDATQVAEADGSVDAVISYAVHHEMPPAVSAAMIREMFRILAPGGEMVISDPPPFRAVSPMQAVILDWDTDNRAEPFFSAAAMANLAQMMRDAGFVDVEEYALEKRGYPWVTRGRKPA
ncbi:MAG: class I SAM-dependent methyltransferase [Steroidobacteraceae bacterium]|jgi:SAM-dependent methyltransferase|nr:class I SAM-dependent methyltransferase [Steroidobacteraceae bacterium]